MSTIDDATQRLEAVQQIVDRQAKDESLWFVAKYVTEDHLQKALRRLHRMVEEGIDDGVET